jgi:amino acid transporter
MAAGAIIQQHTPARHLRADQRTAINPITLNSTNLICFATTLIRTNTIGQPMQHKFKTLGFKDITLYTVSAMLFMDQIMLAASIGISSLFWWAYVLIFLLIPLSMITAELGTTYPQNGGIYQWVRRAFGYRWGARISWMYWITNAIWMPSVYILLTGIFSALYYPELSLWSKVFIGIFLAFATALVNIASLRIGKWLPNIGAILKVICVLALGIAGIKYGLENGFFQQLSWQNLLPSSFLDISALSIMVYAVTGTELACSSADEMANPKRDIPRAALASGLIVGAFNILGTLGILAAIPAEQIDITQIVAESLFNLYGHTGIGYLFANIIAAFIMFTLFTNMVTWSIGTNRAAVEAAEAGELPKIFGLVHAKHQTPVGSSLLAAAVSSVLLLVYGVVATSAEELFWSLLSFSVIILLIPYLAMILAFIKLRLTCNVARPYRMPLSNRVAIPLLIFVLLNFIVAIVMFVHIPGEPFDWSFSTRVVCGVSLALGLGELIIRHCEKANSDKQSVALATLS